MQSSQNNTGRDSLNRRRRDRRQPRGKTITLQARDLLWLQKLHEHGPLSSGFLHAFSAPLAKNEKRAKDRLTDLYNEDRTAHRCAYLDRPLQQFQTLDARYQPLVYDLTPAGERALKDAGLWSHHASHHSGPWRHRYMVATITASIELATLNHPAITFIPQRAILERAGKSLRYQVPFVDPKTKKPVKSDLIPDGVFGLEYFAGGKTSYRFFLVEADRATEPTRASKFNRKSHLRNFLQYREYVGRGLYKQHLNLTAGMLVLNVTSAARTEAALLGLWTAQSPNGNSYQLVQTVPAFGGAIKPANIPIDTILAGDWQRAGAAPFRIDRIGG